MPSPRIHPASPRRFRLVAFTLLFSGTVHGVSGAWLDDQITNIQSRLNTLQQGLNNTYNRANTAAAQALVAAQQTNGLQDLLVRVQTAYQSLDGPVIDLINEVVGMILQFIQRQQEGYDAFATPDGDGVTPADRFRQELAAIVAESAIFLNDMAAVDETLQLELDLSAINDLVEVTPDRILFPMQKAMTRAGGLSNLDLVNRLKALRADLPLLAAAFEGEGYGDVAYAASAGGGPTPLSAWTAGQKAAAVETERIWKVTGITLNLVAKVMGSVGELSEFEGKLGIHGYVAIHYKGNVVKLIAGLIDTLATVITLNGDRLQGLLDGDEAQLRHDELLANQSLIMDNQALILEGQTRLFDAMKRLDPDLFPPIAVTPPAASMAMDAPPSRIHVDFGKPVTLTAGPVESANATYQWRKDGMPIPDAVYSSLIIREATPEDAGDYDVVITDESGSEVSAAASLALIPGRVMNVSVRQVIPDNGVLITGFVLDGEKTVVVRGVGKSLEAFGIPADRTMQDPVIQIFNSSNEVVASNDDYEPTAEADAAMTAVGAFPITAENDAAILTTLPAGAYTVHMKGKDLRGGDCIVEVYDTESN